MANLIDKNINSDLAIDENSVLIPVILSGGAGSRLWPVSREGHPKPFMKMADGQSLLEKTYRRAIKIPGCYREKGKAKLLTITNRDYYFNTCDELEKAGGSGTFLLEPCSRNTAPAIAFAAHHISDKFGPNALMLVLAADHLILDDEGFCKAVEAATQLANAPHNLLVTFGIVPTRPETGFGYIETGQKIEGGQIANAFVEKPDTKKAQAYVDAGNYLWNSGMFCFSAGQFLNQLALCSPHLANAARECWQEMQEDGLNDFNMIEIPEERFKALQNISVDYAVMEKSEAVAVIRGSFGWSDIGSWGAIQNLISPDTNNNRSTGDVIFVKSTNTYVQSDSRLVATLGVSNLTIIDTKDALLVANSENTQEVKTVVDLLRQKKHSTYNLHKTVARPWGCYTILEEGPGFKIKKIEVKPGACLSLQSHKYRSEHWVVVEGEARVDNGNTSTTVLTNQSTYIPAGQKHRLKNPAQNDLVMIEVQCGDYLGEDDIVRFDDIYGRKSSL